MSQHCTTSSIRKAAILLASLNDASAKQLLAQLSPAEARLVREAAAELRGVSLAEREAVAAELSAATPRAAPRPAAPLNQLAGIELDGSLATRLNLSGSQPAAIATGAVGYHAADSALAPFGGLDEVDSASLAGHLANEQPQVIAVVVAHLPHHQAARLLSQFTPDVQRAVVRRLESLDDSDPESVREIERQLRQWMTTQAHYQSKRSAGKSAVAGILAAADPASREILMANLGRKPSIPPAASASFPSHEPREIASQSVEQPVAVHIRDFEELADLSSAVLAALLAQAEPELIALALTGASQRVVQRFCSALPHRVAASLQRALNHPGPTRLSDVETARRELTRLADALASRRTSRSKSSRLSVAA